MMKKSHWKLVVNPRCDKMTLNRDISDQLAAYLRKNQIPQRPSKSSRCHLFLVASLALSDAALDCHRYSQVLELAQSLQFY